MSKEYRSTRMPRPQMFLLPPCLDDFVARDSPVRVFSEIIDSLDMSGLVLDPKNRSRGCGRGAPGYDPRLLFKVLAFAYSDGIRSSRRIETVVRYDMRYLWLSEMTPLDHVTLCRFRKENSEAFSALFKETVQLCRRLGLILLKEVAVDGTKLEANVSGKETFSQKRLLEEEARLDRAIEQLLREADQADGGTATVPRSSGDTEPENLVFGELLVQEVPPKLKDARRRKERIEKARQEMERSHRSAVAATDPESRVMKFGGRRRPAYNAQAVVDGSCQVIVGADVVPDENDSAQLPPMLNQVEEILQVKLEQTKTVALADTGYWSQATLKWVEEQGVDAYINDIKGAGNRPDAHAGYSYDAAQDRFVGDNGRVLTFWKEREKEGRHYRVFRDRNRGRGLPKKELWIRIGDERTSRMRQKLATDEGQAIYRLRQQIVEPVFGHIKVAYNLRRLLLRGLNGARAEFLLACIAHNIGKARMAGLGQATQWATA
jgi:transposase